MMKHTIALILICACSFNVFAQEALWDATNLVSPHINDDNTVTFRLYAPKASKVEVQGDFLPPQIIETDFGSMEGPGTAEMKELKGGVWEYQSDVLPSELYSYSFIVNGQKMNDPSNVYQLRDVSTVTNIFIVGNGQADSYMVQDVPHGTVSKVWYESPTLEMKQRRMTIYTPAGYETSNTKYPVLYLLHGSGGDENAWSELGRTAQILDNLIAQGKAKPMIVVMPNGNASQQAAPGEEPNSMNKPTMTLHKRKDGSFEKAFPDIIKYVEKHYRTINSKSGRAIAGLSMGGFHSLYISAFYPNMFNYVGLFSAANTIENTSSKDSDIYIDFEKKLAVQFKNAPKLYWIGIGEKDFLYKENVNLRQVFDKQKYPYTYVETEGGHTWRNWRNYLYVFAQELFK